MREVALQFHQKRYVAILVFIALLISIPSVYSKEKKAKRRSNSFSIKFGEVGAAEVEYWLKSEPGKTYDFKTIPIYSIGVAFDNRIFKSFN